MFFNKKWKLPTVEELIQKDFFFNGKKEIIFLTNELNESSAMACKFNFNNEYKTIIEVIEIDKNTKANALILRTHYEFKQLNNMSHNEVSSYLKNLNNPISKIKKLLF